MSTDRCYDSHIAAVDVGLTEASLSGVEEYSLQNEPKLLLSIPITNPTGFDFVSICFSLLLFLLLSLLFLSKYICYLYPRIGYSVNSPRKLAINWRLIWFDGMFLLSK